MVTQKELRFSFQDSVLWCLHSAPHKIWKILCNSKIFPTVQKNWKIRYLRLHLFLCLIALRRVHIFIQPGPLLVSQLDTPGTLHTITQYWSWFSCLISSSKSWLCKTKKSPLSLTAERVPKYFALEDQPQIQLWSHKITMQ